MAVRTAIAISRINFKVLFIVIKGFKVIGASPCPSEGGEKGR